MRARRGFLFPVTLLTVVMGALSMLYTGSWVDSGHNATSPDIKITAGPSEYVSWSFAVLTDLHIGREFSDYDGPGYNDSGTPVSGAAADYAQDAVNEINKIAGSQNIAFVAVLGDLTEAAEASELRAAKQILDNLAVPWIPAIGNHDTWPHTHTADGGLGELAPACCPPPDSYFNSIMGPQYANLATEMSGWGKEFPALVYDPEVGRDAYFENFFFDYGGFHFVFLDFNKDGYRAGDLHDFAGGTWSWFKQHMEQFVQQNPERSRDVILLAHHPMTGDGTEDGSMTFSSAELDEISSFTNNTYYSYVDSSGITQTRPYGSRIWGQLAGHTHPWKLQVDYPTWSNGGPVIAYPRNFGGVMIGIVKVTSDTAAGVDYSDPMVATEPATNVSPISASLNGYLASLGTSSSVQVSFEWGTTTSYGFETTPQSMSGPGGFSSNLMGLTDKTTYHFRAKAVGDGTTRGSDMTFTASAVPLTVTTNDATNLAATSATLNGNLAGLGTATSVNVSFEWGLTTSYGNVTTPVARTATGTFSANLTGLTANTSYHYRAKADGDGTTYGSDVTFTTDPLSAPAVTSKPATSITTTSATLHGTLAALGTAGSVVVSFEWGTATGSYTQATDSQILNATGTFSDELSGLTPGTTYYYRAKAVGDGSDEGDEMSFTTSIIRPSVTTGGASDLATTSATLNGELTALGTAASVVVSFEWGTATGSYTQTTDSQIRNATGAFSDELSGLTPGTTYYCRAKADGDGAPVYGLEESFTTAITPPSVSTGASTNLATTSATLNGELAALGTAGSVVVSFEWGTATGSYTQTTDSQMLNATGAFSDELTGLTPGTTYYCRARADGDGAPVYGLEESFTTSIAQPSVNTNDVSNLATTSATLNGDLAVLGTAASVIVSFEWGTASGSYTQTTDTQTLTAPGTFSDELGGLTPGTTYYYRARADGDGDPVYGLEKSFTTSIAQPSVSTNGVSNLATTSATLNGNLAALGTAPSVNVSFEWGTATGSYTQTTGTQTLTATGAFFDELSGLTPGTTYYYRAKADGDGDPVYGLEESFTTSIVPPSVSTNGVSNLATTSATLNGGLAALGTAASIVVSFDWGTTTSYGFETTPESISAIGTFSAALTGLGTQTTYHFRAKAVGDGSAVYGDDMAFTTASLADTTAPVISLVNSTNITSTGATITWTTNEAATSLVEFGLTEEYGSSATLDQNAVNSHRVDLTDLKPGKPYHYRVISKDDSNNQAVSADGTFTTAKSSAGMLEWAWVLFGLAVVGVLGGAAYSISTKTAKK